jgi:predicted amidohydrolase YtcJ
VLNNNLFDIPSAEINETKVLATYFNGKLVYGEL